MLVVATIAECGLRRGFLRVGIPTSWALHLEKCFAIAKAAGSTFVSFISFPWAFML